MTRKRLVLLSTLSLASVGLWSQFTVVGQEAGAIPHAHTDPVLMSQAHNAIGGAQANRQMLRVSVDGKAEPELVPDAYAYRHLLAATAMSDTLTADQAAFVRARVRRIGLSALDQSSYEAALAQVHLRDELARIEEERRLLTRDRATAMSAAAAGTLAGLRNQEKNLLARAYNDVLRGLSAEGAARLDVHVRHVVKRQIKILTGVSHGVTLH